jgi:hypothetical protein
MNVEKSPGSDLKAWTVLWREGVARRLDIVFGSTADAAEKAARAVGANDSVIAVRAPEYDGYAPGPVPAWARLANGYALPCGHCEELVRANNLSAVVTGEDVYCDRGCAARRDALNLVTRVAAGTAVALSLVSSEVGEVLAFMSSMGLAA